MVLYTETCVTNKYQLDHFKTGRWKGKYVSNRDKENILYIGKR